MHFAKALIQSLFSNNPFNKTDNAVPFVMEVWEIHVNQVALLEDARHFYNVMNTPTLANQDMLEQVVNWILIAS